MNNPFCHVRGIKFGIYTGLLSVSINFMSIITLASNINVHVVINNIYQQENKQKRKNALQLTNFKCPFSLKLCLY